MRGATHNISNFRKSVSAVLVLGLASILPTSASNLVTNGNFSQNGGVGELGPGTSTLKSYATGWSVGPTVDGSANPFVFVVNAHPDSQGFPSAFSPPNIYIWGPGTPVLAAGVEGPTAGPTGPSPNGFAGLPNGYTYALGDDGAYATAPVTQTIGGLKVNDKYTLSFLWAATQLAGYTGATTQDWQVTFGGTTVKTPTVNVPSEGFSGWMTYSDTFTATSTSQALTFLAQGSPAVPPFLLIDGIDLEDTTGGKSATPEPMTGGLLLIGGLIGVPVLYRLRRKRA